MCTVLVANLSNSLALQLELEICIPFFLFIDHHRRLCLQLCLWAYRVKMVRNKSVWKFISCDRHSQQFWNSVRQEWFFQNFSHTWALLRLFNKHISYDSLQVFRIRCRNGRVVASQDLQHQSFHRVSIKSVPKCDHFIKDAAERPDIWLLIVWLLLANLRRQVVRGADCSLSAIVRVLQDSSDTKVTYFDLAALRHKYILCLEVTMQDFPVVDVLDGKRHLDEPIEDLIFTIAD